MKKISVIVPIYNTEKFLNKCVDSILAQKIDDIEIILVNDGSPDNSKKIAQEYVENNKDKVIYLEKENGGLSDARNFGLKYATGEYIAFLDSDDYITDNLYADLLPYMEQKYDMVKYVINKVDEEYNFISQNSSPVFENKTGEEAFEILFKQDKMTEVAWGYIYNAKFWKENDFKYEKGLYHEDFGLTPLIMLKAEKVASTNIDGYNYVQTKNSMVRDNKKKAYIRANDLLKHYDNMIKNIDNYNSSKRAIENIKIYYTNAIILSVNNLEGSERKQYISEIRKRKMIKNIKIRNMKQLFKRMVLSISIELFLKLK